MRYLQRTKDYMLVYRKMENLEVLGYTDSDFAGCSDDLKSTSGYIFFDGRGSYFLEECQTNSSCFFYYVS